ncbi:Bacterial extracellular solute-binding proteins, family 3 [Roseovarius albus]|uniref:Bacterial extracellular solute-binding proteins, family 3 n=1 Tax=Roseovarius albus TaxID=1247867 RepID=A0A1X6ZE34_9RHOB|nr:transporter substrate-binding domain-containing protein [Roseovarius albus]SLN48982.1 Bacterial extracellular solute-binding proteins, family 3 [Roseovarius albus]
MFRKALLTLTLTFSVPAQAQDIRFVTLDWAPYVYGKDGQIIGPGRELIEAACDSAELECTFDIFPWRRAQEMMREGLADGMMVIGRNAERETWLDYSVPIIRTEYGFFVHAQDPLILEGMHSIQGKRVGVFAPSNTAVNLEEIRANMETTGLEPIMIDQRPDDASGFRKLAAKRLDAVYSNRDRGHRVLEANELTSDVRYAGMDRPILYYAAIRKTFADPEISERFFASLSGSFTDGSAAAIIENYGLEPAPQ